MVSSFSSKARLDRRIRQLQKESEVVRDDIRSLNRALKNREDLERLPKLKSGKYHDPVPPPTRNDPVKTAGRPNAPAKPPKMIDPGTMEAMPAPKPSAAPQERPVGPHPFPLPRNEAAPPRAPVKDERFANLFSSGGFLGSGHVRQEKNVQKNKAIFMLFVVLIVFFIVYRLVF